MELEFIAICTKHNYRGTVALDHYRTDPLRIWACHQKVNGRWCRFWVKSYLARPQPA